MTVELQDWEVRGEIPTIDPATASAEDLEQLTEDLLHALSADGTLEIDVGFYPEANRNGRFRGVLVSNGVWEAPIEQFETAFPEQIARWLADVSDFAGEPDKIVDGAIHSIVIREIPQVSTTNAPDQVVTQSETTAPSA